jgi:hypothetical protein
VMFSKVYPFGKAADIEAIIQFLKDEGRKK